MYWVVQSQLTHALLHIWTDWHNHWLSLFQRIMSGRRVVVFSSVAELGSTLAQLVSSRAEKALSTGGSFSLGLSGGSLVSILSKELPAVPNLDCSRWLIGFCDERLVPFTDPESTYGLYKVTRCILEGVAFFYLYYKTCRANQVNSQFSVTWHRGQEVKHL